MLEVSATENYFTEYQVWGKPAKAALRLTRGRVLDVGCGAGRHALYLQAKGLDVTGIDVSPGAVRVCRARGLTNARVLSIEDLSPRLGAFDTVLMMGNNFGLFGSFRRAQRLLRRLHRMTGQGARIIAETMDPYQTANPLHRAYHRRNRSRGRMGGQVRLRSRWRNVIGPWLDYLFASKHELRKILRGTGWQVTRFFDSPRASYIVVLNRT